MSENHQPHPPVIADVEETGTLGVIWLKRYWSRILASRLGVSTGARTADELVAENVLMAGLRVGVRETLDFILSTAPTFDEFEAWVLAKNHGSIDSGRIECLNGALRGSPDLPLESAQQPPVLSEADLAFWDENGYVVVKQAVTAEQCHDSVRAIFEHAGMDIDQPDSWYGPAIWILLAQHPALWSNRDSSRIHGAFAQLWKRSDLWMNVDVCGVNPPLRPGYQFRGSALHWDMTLAPPLRFGTQAILYLTDTSADQGAFSCVPGFHRRLERWLKELPPGVEPRARALAELQAIPIAGEAGDLIIWHHALPHGATPNRAALPRVVQYLNMFPSHYEVNTEWI